MAGLQYFEEMKQKGMRILVGTYLSLLSAFADSGNVEQCKRWLAEMEAAGHSVDQVAYAAVINAYRCAYSHNALQLFESLIVISALFWSARSNCSHIYRPRTVMGTAAPPTGALTHAMLIWQTPL
jgi:pentatricopeptide repeat protein